MKKLSLLLLPFLVWGCVSQEVEVEPNPLMSESKAAEPKQIITSFYPLYFLTQALVGDAAEVVNLAGSVDVHTYQLSPQDLVGLNQADLVVFHGAELEPWTDDVIPGLIAKGVNTLEVTHDLDLLEFEAHEDHDEHEDEHEDHEDEEYEAEGPDEHGHGAFDPHTWLDPVLAQDMVDEILEALVAMDSANASTYEANGQALKDRFAKLDQAFATRLASCANQEVVVAHDAYGYLAHRYDFELHAIAGLAPQDEPSAKILAELKSEAAEGITHILIEENNVQRFANTLAAETGLETLPANPLGRGTLDETKDFFAVMEENLQSFQTALNCQ